MYYKNTGSSIKYSIQCKILESALRQEDLVSDLMARFGKICSDLKTRERGPYKGRLYTSKSEHAHVHLCQCVCEYQLHWAVPSITN